MKYFKNSELMRLYNVSDKTVRNWIEAARQSKLGLELFEVKGKTFIADTLSNGMLLEKQTERGRKYRNQRTHRRVSPSAVFYTLYSPREIVDIIANIDIYRELPLQYRYRGEGATFWDAYLHKLYDAGRDNTLADTITLLGLNEKYIDALLSFYEHLNIIDVGVGNGLAVKSFLEHLYKTGKLKRYVGIDISPELLNITEKNIRRWLPGDLSIEKYVRDVTYERFEKILTDSAIDNTAPTANVVLFLGGIIPNFREDAQPLKTIRDSMGKNDIVLCSLKLDSKNSRRFFDFSIDSDKAVLSMHDRQMLQLLQIDETLYEIEQFFDERQMCRLIQIRLRVGLSIQFKMGASLRVIELQKGERLLLRRMRHYSTNDIVRQFEQNGLDVLQTTKTPNQGYILLIAKVKPVEHLPPTDSRLNST